MNEVTAESTENAENAAVNDLTEAVIGAAIDVHRALGPGLLESTYEMCLCHELTLRGVPFERQKSIPVEYKGVKLGCGYRADLLVDRTLLVEVKSVEVVTPIHDAQALDVSKTGRLEYRSDDQLQRAALKTRNSAACPSSAGTRILLTSVSSATSAVNFRS